MNRLALLSIITAVTMGCSSSGPPVHFIVANGFAGEIKLILDKSNGQKVECIDGKYTYRIPLNGELRVTSFEPFQDWHETTASYENGTVIPQDYETWSGPRDEPPKLGKNVTVFQGGEMIQHHDDPPVITFYVGSIDNRFQALDVQQVTPTSTAPATPPSVPPAGRR